VPAVLVDSNVLLDVLTEDAEWYDWSATALSDQGDRSVLVINPIIYAEVSVRFARIEDVDAAFPVDAFRRDPLPWEAAFLAGKAFMTYRRRKGTKHAPLPDFYIGAHAAIAGLALLTRDPKRYETYYPSIKLISPV